MQSIIFCRSHVALRQQLRFASISLQNKTALITGASYGIGAGSAKVLAAKGCNVVLAARSDAGAALEKEINALNGGRAFFVRMDVTKEAEVEAGVKAGVEKFGGLDYVFANAGGGPDVAGPPHVWGPKDIHTIIDTNIKGVIWTTVYALPALLKNKNSAICICSSVAGSLPPSVFSMMPGHSFYSLTKAALDQYVRALAGSYAKKELRVYGVNPYWVDTPLTHKFMKTTKIPLDAIEKMNNTKKLATPEDIGLTVATMFDNSTSYQSGECVMIESGPTTWSMQVYYSQLGNPKAVVKKLKEEGRDVLGNPKAK